MSTMFIRIINSSRTKLNECFGSGSKYTISCCCFFRRTGELAKILCAHSGSHWIFLPTSKWNDIFLCQNYGFRSFLYTILCVQIPNKNVGGATRLKCVINQVEKKQLTRSCSGFQLLNSTNFEKSWGFKHRKNLFISVL